MRGIPQLTMQDREILRYLARGLSAERMAVESFYSVDTIKHRTKTLYRTLGAVNAPNAVALGHAYGYLEGKPTGVCVLDADDTQLLYLLAQGWNGNRISAEYGYTIPAIQYRKVVIRTRWGAPTVANAIDIGLRNEAIWQIPRRNYRKAAGT